MDRRKKFAERAQMFHDNYHKQVEDKLGKIFVAIKELKLDVQINDNNNLYKQIVNTISNVYSFGVSREFSDDNVQELYDTLRVDKTMTQVNKYLNAFNDVILQVSWDDVKSLPSLIVRLPHNVKVEYTAGVVESVKYFIKKDVVVKTEQWAYWSNSEHYLILVDLQGRETKVAVEGNPEMINPLGFLPFVFMHNGWRDESFFDMYTGDDLVGGTLTLAVHLTFLNHILKNNSFRQLVGKGDNIEGLDGQMTDPNTVLSLKGQNTEINVLDLQANYQQLNDTIKDIANNIAINYGVSPAQFRMTSQATSGYALKMENSKLDKFTIEQQQDFRVYEKELFLLLQKVSEFYKSKLAQGTMTIDFIEPVYPTNRKEQIEVDKQQIELGLISPSAILMRDNPDLTLEQAQELVEANLKERNDMLNKINDTDSQLDNLLGA